jgi:hypothetical protein
MSGNAPNLIAYPIDHGLAKVRLHRAHVLRLELIQTPDDVEGRFLDEVFSVEIGACGRRQTTVRPSPQGGKAPLQQRFDSRSVAAARFEDELDGRLVAQERLTLPFAGTRLWGHQLVSRPGVGHRQLSYRHHSGSPPSVNAHACCGLRPARY